jgi:[ribosomal protein S5]-alanine N-acetyltransferase
MLDIHFDTFPILDTPRLILREIVPADAEVLYALRRDPEVTKYLDRDNDADISAVHSLILSIRASFDAGDGITWALCLRDDPTLIGTLGFWKIDKKNHRAEIGYTLAAAFWGQGLMSEAMETVMRYGFEEMRLHSVEANTAVGNLASHALLEKFRFVREAHFRENWYYNGVFTDSFIYCRLVTD